MTPHRWFCDWQCRSAAPALQTLLGLTGATSSLVDDEGFVMWHPARFVNFVPSTEEAVAQVKRSNEAIERLVVPRFPRLVLRRNLPTEGDDRERAW